ncbi:hypothetical protein ACFWXK_00435 [Streptomyces sp. NPDC059070]|uniref:hypothetical protein n=1 Tax=Streptomyces sp. NPDC059070 TaxID=3346713 RepID=UPI0036A77750
MTNETVLAACRSNWEYRGIDDASVRAMLDELTARLEAAEAAGGTPQDVVGSDVRTFAASWARARTPLPRRALRLTAMASFVAGCLLLVSHLVRWTTELDVSADRIAFFVAIAAVTVFWELCRGSLGLGRSWAVALVVGLPVLVLTRHFAGGGTLVTVPLWGAALLVLPGLPYALADARARKAAR